MTGREAIRKTVASLVAGVERLRDERVARFTATYGERIARDIIDEASDWPETLAAVLRVRGEELAAADGEGPGGGHRIGTGPGPSDLVIARRVTLSLILKRQMFLAEVLDVAATRLHAVNPDVGDLAEAVSATRCALDTLARDGFLYVDSYARVRPLSRELPWLREVTCTHRWRYDLAREAGFADGARGLLDALEYVDEGHPNRWTRWTPRRSR